MQGVGYGDLIAAAGWLVKPQLRSQGTSALVKAVMARRMAQRPVDGALSIGAG